MKTFNTPKIALVARSDYKENCSLQLAPKQRYLWAFFYCFTRYIFQALSFLYCYLGLENTLYAAGPSSWPKRCPTGYSQHLAVIDENCEINYCVKANSLSVQGLPTVKRPPFRSPPKMNHNITIPLSIVNDDTGKVWFKEPNSLTWIQATKRWV